MSMIFQSTKTDSKEVIQAYFLTSEDAILCAGDIYVWINWAGGWVWVGVGKDCGYEFECVVLLGCVQQLADAFLPRCSCFTGSISHVLFLSKRGIRATVGENKDFTNGVN